MKEYKNNKKENKKYIAKRLDSKSNTERKYKLIIEKVY